MIWPLSRGSFIPAALENKNSSADVPTQQQYSRCRPMCDRRIPPQKTRDDNFSKNPHISYDFILYVPTQTHTILIFGYFEPVLISVRSLLRLRKGTLVFLLSIIHKIKIPWYTAGTYEYHILLRITFRRIIWYYTAVWYLFLFCLCFDFKLSSLHFVLISRFPPMP